MARRKRRNTGHSGGRNLGYGITNGKMMRSQLTSIRRSATNLRNVLRDEDQVPAWVLTKAAVALSKLQSAENYIVSKLEGRTRNPDCYQRNKAETAKKLASSVGRAASAFGRGAKKAAIATGKAAKKAGEYTAYQSKLAALNGGIIAEKNYLKKLEQCGRDLEVSQAKVKDTKAYKGSLKRIADFQERIKKVKADYAAKKTNPKKKGLKKALQNRIAIANKYIKFAIKNDIMAEDYFGSTYPTIMSFTDKNYIKVSPTGTVVTISWKDGYDRRAYSEKIRPNAFDGEEEIRYLINGIIRGIKKGAKEDGWTIGHTGQSFSAKRTNSKKSKSQFSFNKRTQKNEITIDGRTFQVTPELFMVRSPSEIKKAIKHYMKTGSYKGTSVSRMSSNFKEIGKKNPRRRRNGDHETYFTEEEIDTASFVGDRYGWSSSLLDAMTYNDDGSGQVNYMNYYDIQQGIESDMEGGHSAFPMLNTRSGVGSDLADKLIKIYNSEI